MFDDTASLPEYQLRISKRARRVLIKVTPTGQVEVVVPQGFDVRAVPGIVAQRRDWITASRRKAARQSRESPDTHGLLPRRIELAAIGECWHLQASPGQQRTLVAGRHDRVLKYRPDSPPHQVAASLRNWLQRRAVSVLPPWLQEVAGQHGFDHGRIAVRGQKTRWGSCSARGNINLNRNLLLLPADTVHYLFIHELCHTLHMNHSAKFWQEVAARVPDYRRHDRELGRQAGSLPLWVYA